MVKIKNVKKFEKYNMRIAKNEILLLCNENNSLEKIKEYNDHELVKDAYNIGENINKEINQYCVKEAEKINDSVMKFDTLDRDKKNTRIIELLKNACANDFKNEIIVNTGLLDEENKNNVSNDFYDDTDIDKYVAFYNIFKNCYKLFKEHKVNTKELNTPEEIQEMIRLVKYGISDTDLKFGEAQTKLSINYKTLLKILKNNIDYVDYSPLLNSVSYIPLNIKNLLGGVIENRSTSKSSENIFTQVKNFCEVYGVPYWKTEIYSRREVEIPINNFILICLAIYIYKELWNKVLCYDDASFEWDDYICSFYVLGIDFEYDEKVESIIKKTIRSIEDIDFYISNNCNELLNHKLNSYRKKVLDKSSNTLTNETIYDSTIVAAWNIFYLYYFGSDKKLKPIKYKICDECHKEIRGKSHTLRDGSKKRICDCCNKKRRNLLNSDRVNKYRSRVS